MYSIAITIYAFKALVILTGLAVVYMGYKLFDRGITAPAGSFMGEVEGKGKLRMTRFAPGIFFALVGSVVVVVGSTRSFKLTNPNGSHYEGQQALSEAMDTLRLESDAAKAWDP